MPSRENVNVPDFPIEEAAPTLATYWSMDPPAPVHVSELTPDPEAKMSLEQWARLYYQMCKLDLHDETPAIGLAPDDTGIAIHFPVAGLHQGGVSVTWMNMGSGTTLEGENGIVEGHRQTSILLDLQRPGVVEATDVYITLPETVRPPSSMEAAAEINGSDGVFMASDGSSIAFQEISYEIGDASATELIEMLRHAKPLGSDPETINELFMASLDRMDPSLKEACHRYFVLGKSLIRKPEAMVRNRWSWGYTYAQYVPQPREALHGWLPDKYVVYAPPGVRASDSEMIRDFFDEREDPGWTCTVWDESVLPDNYDPLFESPTEVREISAEEILAELPAEQHIYIARYVANQICYWDSRIRTSLRDGGSEWDAMIHERRAETAAEYIRLFPEIAAEYPPVDVSRWSSMIEKEGINAIWEKQEFGKLPPIPEDREESS